MFVYPEINPVAISIGPFKIYWYGLMYLLGFLGAWFLATTRAKRPGSDWNSSQISDLIFYGALGVVIGGRLGFMFVYDFANFIQHPWQFFYVWRGGMSFHGGLIGVAVSLWLFSRKFKKDFFAVTDFAAPLVPLGLAAGRIGNFINGELWGRVTTMPWGVIYPHAGPLARHPSELYEFFLEGIVLFVILWFYSAKPRPRTAVSALFLLAYGVFRFFVEFFRAPDVQLGYIVFGLTMGQLLSIPMIIGGIYLLYLPYRNKTVASSSR